ncbi:glycosyltransferase [Candidatus Woesearchaeota archaeon]|nr:glycosyltransferase [Candidatus Woesearchaeota archaeon]
MRILHVIPAYSVEWGGPSKVVHDLSEFLSKKGVAVDILTTYGSEETLYPVPENVNLISLKRNKFSRIWTGFSIDAFNFLRNNIKKYDCLHIHELWHFPHFASYWMRETIPYAVTTHGQLDGWCLSHEGLRKKVYSFLIQKKILEKATIIKALTLQEKENIVNYDAKLRNKIVIIPNGINVTEFKNIPEKGFFKSKHAILREKKYILFLGRINIIKGLDILVSAFKKLSREYQDLYLVIVGADDNDYAEKIKKSLKKEGLFKRSIFTGMLTGREKLSVFADAHLFVLPSYSESFPMAVIESMACGIPVVISNKVGIYKEVQSHNAGIIVKTSADNLYEGMKTLLENEDLRREIAENGKKLAMANYDINEITDMTIEVYRKMNARRE